jgi:WD40 repeat protein
VAAGTEDGKIEIWNYNTGNLETSLLARHDWINALVILGNGRVASASDDRTISIWNPSKDGLDARLEGHSGRVNALAVLPVLRKKPYRAVFNPM